GPLEHRAGRAGRRRPGRGGLRGAVGWGPQPTPGSRDAGPAGAGDPALPSRRAGAALPLRAAGPPRAEHGGRARSGRRDAGRGTPTTGSGCRDGGGDRLGVGGLRQRPRDGLGGAGAPGGPGLRGRRGQPPGAARPARAGADEPHPCGGGGTVAGSGGPGDAGGQPHPRPAGGGGRAGPRCRRAGRGGPSLRGDPERAERPAGRLPAASRAGPVPALGEHRPTQPRHPRSSWCARSQAL
ncbi:MAG: hypothetical protein AVDCRST_MAG61-3037, partial [uncultured Friedmanniella sp.]